MKKDDIDSLKKNNIAFPLQKDWWKVAESRYSILKLLKHHQLSFAGVHVLFI